MPSSQIWVVLLALFGVWWLAIRMLWGDWDIDPQYSYGFLIPFLCIVLFYQRWKDRPPASAPDRLNLIGVFAISPLAFLVLVQPFYEANPEWRILGLFGALCAVFLTLLLIWSIGGRAWLGHFFFPIVFFVVGIPWPRNLEEGIMGYLMEKNAMATLEALHWLGYEAVRRGHLISLPNGTLGVEEACSGVRSLQSGIMASLFVGELFRFGYGIRGILFIVSILSALAGNFLRATFLSIIATRQGMSAVEKWHDIAGFGILGLTLGLIWLAAHIANQKGYGADFLKADKLEISEPMRIPHIVVTTCGCIILLSIASLGGTELWYRSHERMQEDGLRWALKSGSKGTKQVPIADRTRRILFFPEGFSEKFTDGEGRVWQFFFFRWPPGRTAIQAMNIHDPRTCLSSIGMVLEKQLPSMTIPIGQEMIRFRVFIFRDGTRPILVFHSIIAEGMSSGHDWIQDNVLDQEGYTLKRRWQSMTNGTRNQGQTLLEAAVWNTTDVEGAAKTLAKFLTENSEPSRSLRQ